jgi:hypothetical protein
MPSLQHKLAQENTRYTTSQLVQLRRQMLRFARSLPLRSSERNERRQIASSLRSLSRGNSLIGKETFSMRVTSAAFESSVLEAPRVSGGAALKALSEDQADCCPHCRSPFEIVHIKFRFNGTAMIATCPNCAIASVEEWRAAESKILDNAKKLAVTARGFWQGVASRMDSLDQRFR